jgi:hypothetical protein
MTDPRTAPVRFSNLKHIASSPAHYLASLQGDYGDSLARRIGSGTHALLFGQPVAVWRGKVRRGKEWDEWREANEAATIVNAKEYEQAMAITTAVRSSELARSILFAPGTILERRHEWRVNGRLCAGTPDAYNRRAVIDLKTHRRMPPAKFINAARWMAYHSQVSWYADGLASIGLVDEDAAQFIVAVESSAPFAVTVYQLTTEAIDLGKRLWRGWMEQLATCEQSDQWPAYAQCIVPFHVEQDVELDFGDTDPPELFGGDTINEENAA